MGIITKKKKGLIEWLLYLAGYTIVFIIVTSLFKSIHIDNNNLVLWSFIIVTLVYILNKTIKPILVTLTIPITAMTLGLFYPFVNVFILKIVDWILGSHFQVKSIVAAFFAAILLSITNFIMESIMKRIVKRLKR